MIAYLKGWDGRHDEESVSASVYSFTIMHLYESWFHKLLPGNSRNNDKMIIMDSYPFNDFI